MIPQVVRMHFLLNDVVLSLELQLTTPPMEARRVSSLSLEQLEQLGREIYAREPRLHHREAERARSLASLIVSKAPEVNGALFIAPSRGCAAEDVAVRFITINTDLLAQLHQQQQSGRMTAALADEYVWGKAAA